MDTTVIEMTDTDQVWERSRESEKFMDNGLWGLRDKDGKTILQPEFDQIECCKDFVYAHSGTKCFYYFPIGKMNVEDDNPNDLRFYADGKIGLKDQEGKVRFPAVYDCIKVWEGYDVVYVRNEEGFHYYNSANEEILTDFKPVEGSPCENEPFYIDERQSTGVLITRRLVEGHLNNNCVRAGDLWVEMERIPCRNLRKVIGTCEVIPMPEDAFHGFESPSTYIYRAFLASSKKDSPVEDCVAQFTMLGAYRSTWKFITKVWIHPESDVNMEELKKFWLMYSENSDFYLHEGIRSRFGVEDWLRIGIGHDASLDRNEVKVLQMEYFTDRWPEKEEQEWVTALRHKNVQELEKYRQRLLDRIAEIRNEHGDIPADIVYAEALEGCHIMCNTSTELSDEEELEKYYYLCKLGFHCIDTLWYLCAGITARSFNEEKDGMKPMEEKQLSFCLKKTKWLLRNSTGKNYVLLKMTPLDMITMTKKMYEQYDWPVETQVLLTEMEMLMRRNGCRYSREFPLDDLFWRQFKPGLYDELPFETRPYISKTSIGDVVTDGQWPENKIQVSINHIF